MADRRKLPRGGLVLVELVRLVVVVVCAAGGYESARAVVSDPRSSTVLVGALIGAGVGYVFGGVFGRLVGRLAGTAESRIAQIPGADIVAGALGIITGLMAGSAVSWPLLFLPSRAAGVAVIAFVLIVAGYVGFRIATIKREDLLQLVGLSFRTRAADLKVLDTSAILDPRLLDLVRTGVLRGTLLVPEFVLEEAQGIADSADAVRRKRAHVGLEALSVIRREGLADVRPVDKMYPEFEEVDAKVTALARERGATLVTDDAPLARVAELQGIETMVLRNIAAALRPLVKPGDVIRLELVRAGTKTTQGAGYLDDGTLVVVEDAGHLVGRTVDARVMRSVPTTGGHMLFAHVEGVDARAVDPAQ